LINCGVVLMGRFDYNGAYEVFAELVERQPDWLWAKVCRCCPRPEPWTSTARY
jgi:hypothetical protein